MHTNFSVTLLMSLICLTESRRVITEDVRVGTIKNFTLNGATQWSIYVSGLFANSSKSPLRLELKCFQCNRTYPALIAVKDDTSIISYNLPYESERYNRSYVYINEMSRTLCPTPAINSRLINSTDNEVFLPLVQNVIVSLYTSSPSNISVELKLKLVSDFLLKPDENKTFYVTQSAPVIFMYEFPNSTQDQAVMFKIWSPNETCMVVNIQNRTCPFLYYKDPQAKNYLKSGSGSFITVSKFGAQLITREIFPNGFFAIFSVINENICSLSSSFSHGANKTVHISLSNTTEASYYKVVYITLGIVGCTCLLQLSLAYLSINRQKADHLLVEDVLENQEAGQCSSKSQLNERAGVSSENLTNPQDTWSLTTNSSLDETDLDVLIDSDCDKNVYRSKSVLYLSDLSKKNPNVLQKKSELYVWILLTVGIFYSLPASQVTFNDLSYSIEDGNGDLCYFNSQCSHPWGIIRDSNHVLSNIGYIVFGLEFLLVVYSKHRIHNALIGENKKLATQYGVPQHFGLFYSMGIAMIMEGVLSAFYHLCPNIYNFQFDVSFMYVISILCMVKIYQSRHPDVNATAYSTFFVLALALFLEVSVLFKSNATLWGVFTMAHVFICLYVSCHVYYVRRYRVSDFVRILIEIRFFSLLSSHHLRPMYPVRFGILLFMNMCNWGMAALPYIASTDILTHLLLVFMVNLVLYSTFYLVMKVINKEKILLPTIIYILISVSMWCCSVYFFLNKVISWKLSPAESRLYSKSCVLFNYYDNHDIWHFTSAVSLFFSFLVLLTLDDDLIYIPRTEILAF